MAQTAVEFLVNYMKENFHLTDEALIKFEQAKQMEKEQKEKAHIEGQPFHSVSSHKAEQYYTQTYGTRLQNQTNRNEILPK